MKCRGVGPNSSSAYELSKCVYSYLMEDNWQTFLISDIGMNADVDIKTRLISE